MKNLRKAIAVILVLVMTMILAATLLVEAKSLVVGVSVEDKRVSSVDVNLSRDTDNSDLVVKVIKQTGRKTEIIYTGLLGEFESGIWSDIDFDGVQFAAIFDWRILYNQAMYIVPISSDEENQLDETVFSEELVYSIKSSVETSDSDDSISFCAETVFWNNDGYCEYITEDKSVLGADLVITNNSGASENVKPYFALYKDNLLCGAKMLETQSIGTGETLVLSENFPIDEDNTESYSVQVFNWNDKLAPLTEAVSVSGIKSDYYGDSIENATFITDTEKQIHGSLNDSTDKDYIKFVAENSGSYTFSAFSLSENMTISLYDSSGSALKESFTSASYNLTAGNTYYVKAVNVTEACDYIFSISYDPLADAVDFDVYKFDIDVNVYKNSISEICSDLYSKDRTLSKQMYYEYELILDDDAKLHTLPDFLSDHPKELSNFDDLLNEYYGTKYNDFAAIKQRYIDLIDKYAEIYDTLTASAEVSVTELLTDEEEEELPDESVGEEKPIIAEFIPPRTAVAV